MQKYVYRMQNKDGTGCYAWGSHLWITRDHLSDSTPSPFDDKVLKGFWKSQFRYKDTADYRFGFETRQQADEWFSDPGEIYNLERLGFTLHKVPAREIIYGDKQVIFIPEEKTP